MNEVLGMLNYESEYRYLSSPEDAEWYDSTNHSFKFEVKSVTQFGTDIRLKLAKWIKRIKYTYIL